LAGLAAARWRAQIDHYLPLIARVLDQRERWVLHGQAVPTHVQYWPPMWRGIPA
jgi:hypothetical protein